ncbi:hypothetical protein GW17_00051207 [Ensete ventricosum]|nr:hypothetical protein GW17_00051207 [Ensete ventricosum]
MGCGSMVGSERCVSCTTFNILAPIYKRLSEEASSRFSFFVSSLPCRESQYRAYWLSRNERIIERLLGDRSSIICLQYIKSIQLGVAGHPHGLGPKDTNDLWVQVDIDGNGVVDYEKFQYAPETLFLSIYGFQIILHGLGPKDTKDLWVQADIDGNSVMDNEQFQLLLQQRIWNPKCSEPPEEKTAPGNDGTQMMGERQQTFGFNVKDAVLFPPEVERGMWPENYSLSDHAPLTVVFSPVSIPCGQPIC